MTDAESRAIDYVLRNEGGDADVAGDRGGVTRCGISWRSYPNDPIFTMTEPVAIRERARAIYLRDYVAPLKLDAEYSGVLAKVVDFAVVAGVVTSAKALQRALIACGAAVAEDGQIGDQTRAAIAVECVRHGEGALLAQLCRQHALHFCAIVERRREQGKFLLGWTLRAMRVPT